MLVCGEEPSGKTSMIELGGHRSSEKGAAMCIYLIWWREFISYAVQHGIYQIGGVSFIGLVIQYQKSERLRFGSSGIRIFEAFFS